MTSPTPASIREHDQRALAFEEQAAADVSAALRLLIADAARRLAADYIRIAGDLKTPVGPEAKSGVKAAVRRVVVALATGLLSELPRVLEALATVRQDGLAMGVKSTSGRRRRIQLRASRDLNDAVRSAEQSLRDDVAALTAFTDQFEPRRYTDVTTVLGKAQRVAGHVEQTARWVANRAINEGVRAVALSTDGQVMWVAEANACLTCLAYSGEVVDADKAFPAGRTFGKTSTVKTPITTPPAHPSCRCRLQVWYGQDEPLGVPLPNALKREAERSVLRGDSDYATRPAKLNAAARLLATALSGLPDTVKLRARRNVAAGPNAWRTARRAPRSRP